MRRSLGRLRIPAMAVKIRMLRFTLKLAILTTIAALILQSCRGDNNDPGRSSTVLYEENSGTYLTSSFEMAQKQTSFVLIEPDFSLLPHYASVDKEPWPLRITGLLKSELMNPERASRGHGGPETVLISYSAIGNALKVNLSETGEVLKFPQVQEGQSEILMVNGIEVFHASGANNQQFQFNCRQVGVAMQVFQVDYKMALDLLREMLKKKICKPAD